MAKIYKLFTEKMGGRAAADFIGGNGEIFYDPENPVLRISDGATPGGTLLNLGSGGPVTGFIAELGEDFTITTSSNLMSSPPGIGSYDLILQANGTIKVPGTITAQHSLTLRSGANQTVSLENGLGGHIEIGYQENSGDVYIGAGGYGTLVSIEADRFRVMAGAPATSKGQAGDQTGMIAFTPDYIFYCTSNYSNGTLDIWKRVALTGGTW